jgi:hypothetical protein
VPDVGDTLAALDQRLADLRRQIDDLAHAPEPAPPTPPPAPRVLPLPTGLAGDAQTAEPTALGSVAAQALSGGVDRLGSQIEDLLRMRQQLLADARDLLRRYERRLDELEARDTSDIHAAVSSVLGSDLAAPARPNHEGEPPRPPAFFEGLVTMMVGGASRIQTIQVLEDALSRVQHVEQVYIRRWHAGALWLELTVSAGVELLGELGRALPFAFAVQSATGRELLISLEGER